MKQTVLESPMSVDLASSRLFASFHRNTVRCSGWGRGPDLIRSCESWGCRHVVIEAVGARGRFQSRIAILQGKGCLENKVSCWSTKRGTKGGAMPFGDSDNKSTKHIQDKNRPNATIFERREVRRKYARKGERADYLLLTCSSSTSTIWNINTRGIQCHRWINCPCPFTRNRGIPPLGCVTSVGVHSIDT